MASIFANKHPHSLKAWVHIVQGTMRDLRPGDKVVYSGKVENVDADR
jgi:hypothetical protein